MYIRTYLHYLTELLISDIIKIITGHFMLFISNIIEIIAKHLTFF